MTFDLQNQSTVFLDLVLVFFFFLKSRIAFLIFNTLPSKDNVENTG